VDWGPPKWAGRRPSGISSLTPVELHKTRHGPRLGNRHLGHVVFTRFAHLLDSTGVSEDIPERDACPPI